VPRTQRPLAKRARVFGGSPANAFRASTTDAGVAWRLGQGRTSNVAARSWRSAGAASFPKRPCLVRSCQKLAVSHPDYDGVFGMTRRQAAARSISGSETTHDQCEAASSRPPESGALSERALLSHHHPPRRIGLTSNFQGAQLKEDKPVRVRRRDIWMT
jgi:hypothetical protein